MCADRRFEDVRDRPDDVLCAAAADIHDAAAKPEQRAEVLRTTPEQLAARLGVHLSHDDRAWLEDVLDSAKALCRALDAADQMIGRTAAGLDAAGVGFIASDASGVASHLDRTASHLLSVAEGDRLDVVMRAVRALADANDAEAVFREAVGPTRTLLFRRAGGRPCQDVPWAESAHFLSVAAVDIAPWPSSTRIAHSLGVTQAEARLCAALVGGFTVAAAAASLGIKLSTARSQLRSIFAKTNTRRQAELMALLTSLRSDPE